ncbi:energy-coupling factor transporter transmembrane protein EcfT [uncultured Lactobacillus sp.]|uniref:energy-coupling factor transporter transmembrane component T family protein n=1 Tax=uncultured Lactobacillus sp. TaxID=153152 RepID=UPI00260C6839|nr:energy-coupling factor transporter transmembrane component T [uncultured Lactobacillus sp.]
MHDESQILGYQPGNSFIYQLNATTKLVFMLLVSIACMITYDTRFLIAICVLSIFLFKEAKIKWSQISFIVKLIVAFMILNLIFVFIFQPSYGESIYYSKSILIHAGYFTLTLQEVFYLFNLFLKYVCSIPIVLLFLLTTNPSQFAASLNKIGISYKISYAVSLALRYIPDIQNSYWDISAAQQARGIELSKKASLGKRIKGTLNIIMPLIFSSLERIDAISTAMQLRRFGSKKKRTWYVTQSFKKEDYLVMIAAVILVLIVIVLWQLNHGRFYNPFI